MKKISIVQQLLYVTILTVVVMLGCGNDKGAGTSGEKNQNRIRSLQITKVFRGTEMFVTSNPIDWSPDGRYIAFDAQLEGANVYKVAAQENASVIKVTGFSSANPVIERMGKIVTYIQNGSIIYYLWNRPDTLDQQMHLMAASEQTVDFTPTPKVHCTFNGDQVGMPHNQGDDPMRISVSADGRRAAISWRAWGVYLMEITDGKATTRPLPLAKEATVSRDGANCVYRTDDNSLFLISFTGTTSGGTFIGKGIYPSWSSDNRIGYFRTDDSVYVVYNTKDNTSLLYKPSVSLYLYQAVLSWDGTKVAFRDSVYASAKCTTGISFGILGN